MPISRKAVSLPSAVAVLVPAGAVLFWCYLRQSWTRSLNSDGAADILQAHNMLQGNVLLHGWQLSQVSFWSTELPQYMLLESVMGVRVAVVHVAGAMTGTLLVLLAALLAMGRATGREAVVRMLVAGGIMLAPQFGPGTAIFMLSPDHAGTAVPLLVTWLVVDRLADRRWWTPVIVVVLLAWALVADPLVLWAGLVPLADLVPLAAGRASTWGPYWATIADLTCRRSLCCASSCSAIRTSELSKKPPVSPARIIAT